MKRICFVKGGIFFFVLVAGFFTLKFSAAATFGGTSEVSIYKGRIEDTADIIVRFPNEEEGREIYTRLTGIVEDFKTILLGEREINVRDIEDKCHYVLGTYRETEILEWCLLNLCLDQSLSLLPGEGIELTLDSYCLDAGKASPSVDEFYKVEKIDGEQAVWLEPLLAYAGQHAEENLPVQGLIWNMGRNIPFGELPADQQSLLKTVVPDAETRFTASLGKKLFSRLKREVRSRAGVISDLVDVVAMVEAINARKSKLELILPKHDVFRLDNGLLVKIKSTGSLEKLKLIIVNPKENEGRPEERSSLSFQGVFNKEGVLFCFGRRDFQRGGPYILETGPAEPIPFLGLLFTASSAQSKWEKAGDWWNNNKGKIESWSKRAKTAKDIIDSYNEGGLKGVENYVKGRGFDEGLDFFKSFQKGNPQAERAFELFRKFNKDLMDKNADKQQRPEKDGLKSFKPWKWKFKPGRGDVQPLATSGRF